MILTIAAWPIAEDPDEADNWDDDSADVWVVHVRELDVVTQAREKDIYETVTEACRLVIEDDAIYGRDPAYRHCDDDFWALSVRKAKALFSIELSATAEDGCIRWLREHAEELAQYSGEQIAVHAVHGVVAHGTALDELRKQVAAQKLTGQVLYSVVPRMNGK